MSEPDSRHQGECFHCGLPVPPGSAYRVTIDGEPRAMCCPGCQAVAQAIVDGGMEDFYRHRTEKSERPEERIPDFLREVDLYDRPELQKSFVREEAGETREASLILEGIVCAACVWLNERQVKSLDGVLDFRVNYATHRARVRWDPARVQLSDILRAIAAIGYRAHPFDPGRQEQLFKREKKLALRRLTLAGLGAMQVMMIAIAMYIGDYQGMDADIRRFMRWVSLLIATPVVLYSAQAFFAPAWRDLRRRQPGMDVPVSLAIGGAYLASCWATFSGTGEVYFDSVTMFTFFLLTGRYFEMIARHKAGESAEALVKLLPASATRITADGREEVVTVNELAPGDRLRVRPGESVPADGTVVAGESSVDESLLTGESVPRGRAAGDALVGGSVNVESPLEMTVTRVGEDTVLSSIIRLLDRAQGEKPRVGRLADRVAGWFVLALLLLAVGVGGFWWWHEPESAFWITLSVLVVTCPCALSLATPAALTAATGRLTRLGLLTTRGHALETLARVTDVVLDKTGTLTFGELGLAAIRPEPGENRERLWRVAAALEAGSEHPIARAIRRDAPALGPAEAAHAVRQRPGLGIEGSVGGRRYRVGNARFVAEWVPGLEAAGREGVAEVLLVDEQRLLGRFELDDALRPEAAEAVDGLRRRGLRVHLLSGDAAATVDRVAGELGIEEHRGGLLPDDKLARIRELQDDGAVVAMVGDGINDAPVLAGAQVSLAMGGGTQLAHASADLVLLSENLLHLPEGIDVARRTLRIIRQNLGWAVAYNVTAVPLAAAGFVAPWMAAIGMSLSSLLVVLNALRLR